MDTLDYYERMAKANGGMDQVQNWSRMFLVPGMYHCRGGEFTLDNFDLLTAAVTWVEKGTAPDSVIATGKLSPAGAGHCAPIPSTRITTAKATRKMRRTSSAANDTGRRTDQAGKFKVIHS